MADTMKEKYQGVEIIQDDLFNTMKHDLFCGLHKVISCFLISHLTSLNKDLSPHANSISVTPPRKMCETPLQFLDHPTTKNNFVTHSPNFSCHHTSSYFLHNTTESFLPPHHKKIVPPTPPLNFFVIPSSKCSPNNFAITSQNVSVTPLLEISPQRNFAAPCFPQNFPKFLTLVNFALISRSFVFCIAKFPKFY